jgi:protein-L-isoaspartate(D-aspartate) O-methyltransferase
MDIEQARFNMIEQQIRPWNVLDSGVLDLLASVRREDFVPAAYRGLAFVDMEIPLPCGQNMLAPKVEARLLQELAVRKDEWVLEIGAGSGFMAALLGHRAAAVQTLELHEELVAMARANLQRAGMSNVTVEHADGAHYSKRGEFDVIVLSGSVAQIPQDLLQRLKPGGRLAAIVGDEPVMRAQIVTRVTETDFVTRDLFDTVTKRLENFPEPPRFRF